MAMDPFILENRWMRVQFDRLRGTVTSLKQKNDPFGTDYVGNPANITYPSFLAAPRWLGDIRIRTWTGSGWQNEETACSDDIRFVRHDPEKQTVEIAYAGKSKQENGLRSVELKQSFRLAYDSLFWQIDVTNRQDGDLEIGELSLAFTMNNDFSGLFVGKDGVSDPDWRRNAQKAWHEDRVLQHLFISGHSSYAMLQRPLGDGPFLLFHTVDDTPLEVAYQIDKTIGSQWSLTFEGPYYLSVHSAAARKEEKWLYDRERQSYWFHGHSSLLLKPGETRVYRFCFAFLNRYEHLNERLYQYGQVAVKVHPGMAVQMDQETLLELTCKQKVKLVPESEHIRIETVKRDGDRHTFRLRFLSSGQKKIRVEYGANRWMNLLFYATPAVGPLLKARARFIIRKQLYDNPQDRFGRHHAFLPYDDKLEALCLQGEESWQVGGSDEYGLPIGMFLAEKNVYFPNREEIDVLETYIDDFLFCVLQNPKTYEIRRGCYWEEKTPSSYAHQWSKEESEYTWRSFNYPLVANIYHAMYRIAKLYGLTRKRSGSDYLTMAWKTAVLGYDLGEWSHMGGPAGYNAVHLLRDLREEDPEGYSVLNEKMRRFAIVNNNDPYPFGSELYIDQTAHNQVYAIMREYGFKEQERKTLQVTKALRAGAQPVWFRYGNEQRGNVCCWYATTLNSYVLLSGFEETGDMDLLRWGYAGLSSFMTTVRENGAARGWFTWWPDRTGFDQRSLDTDMGLYGFLKAAKAYVVKDESFGLVGYGCRVTRQKGVIEIVPCDGLSKRMFIAPFRINLEMETGELAKVAVSEDGCRMTVEIFDSTRFVHKAKLRVTGPKYQSEKIYDVEIGDQPVTVIIENGRKTD